MSWPEGNVAYGPFEMVGDLLVLVEKRWATVRDIELLIEPLQVASVTQRILCLRELRRFIRLLPIGVFRDDEQRDNLLSVFQAALDQAIDDEEVALQSEAGG